MRMLPWLIEGYQERTPLADDYEKRICFTSLLIAIRTLARTWGKRLEAIHNHYCLLSLPNTIQVLLG